MDKDKQKFPVQKFIVWTVVFVIVVRLWMLFFFGVFGSTGIGLYVKQDSLHHYHIGILLLFISWLFRKHVLHFIYVLSLGTAFIIEEYAVLFGDFKHTLYPYGSFEDSLLLLGVCLGILVLWHISRKRKK